MKPEIPKSYGCKIPIGVYVDLDLFAKIEDKRGKKSRNSFLVGVIENSLKN